MSVAELCDVSTSPDGERVAPVLNPECPASEGQSHEDPE